MAKKTSKKAASKKAASKKKTSAKKSSSTKKKTSTSSSAKKAPAKKASSASKKTTKKPAPKKKTTKAPSKKKTPTVKKTTSKKAGATATKAAASKTTSKKTSTSKVSKKTQTKKSAASSKAETAATSPANPDRFRAVFGGGGSTGRAAAAKLAAAAGLAGVRSSATDAPGREKKYKRLTKSPLDEATQQEFRVLLIEKRRQILGDVTSMENEALGGNGGSLSHLPQHMADQGSDTFDQSLNLDLAASQRGLLKEIDDALDRIAANTYGICELLGKPIKLERLRNTPWARFSIEAAREIEKNPFLLRKNDDD